MTGISSLGYVGFKVSDLEAWSAFATQTLGLMLAEEPAGALRYRLDAQAWRIAVEPGEEDDLAYVGFEVAGPAELAAIAERLTAAGVATGNRDPDLVALRGVTDLITCHDPEGLAIEIYYGPTERLETPFVSPAGIAAFVTEGQGLGHVVLFTKDAEARRGFYCDILGFQLSDTIGVRMSPEMAITVEFYHCNARHHTLAFIPLPGPKKLHHFMIQTANLDDVGFALERLSLTTPLTSSLGRHPNDEMVSFYARTPSGFEVEFGWGAREVGPDWRVVRHEKTSIWGHHSQQ